MRHGQVGTDFVGGAACDKEIFHELTVALLSEALRDIGRNRPGRRSQLRSKIEIPAYFLALQKCRNCRAGDKSLSVHQQFIKSSSKHAARKARLVPPAVRRETAIED